MKVFVLYCETTGLIRNHVLPLDLQAEVIEFYGANVDLAEGKITNEIGVLIKPKNYPISNDVMKKTKLRISNEMLEYCKPFAGYAPIIKKHIEAASNVLAHNASFDMEMLDIEFERLRQCIKWPRAICTVEQTVHLKSDRLPLTNFHKYLFDEIFPNAHRAKADSQALIRCAVELYKRELL